MQKIGPTLGWGAKWFCVYRLDTALDFVDFARTEEAVFYGYQAEKRVLENVIS